MTKKTWGNYPVNLGRAPAYIIFESTELAFGWQKSSSINIMAVKKKKWCRAEGDGSWHLQVLADNEQRR